MNGVLITGAGGYIGRQVVKALAADPGDIGPLVAVDIRLPEPADRLDGVVYAQSDVRAPDLAGLMRDNQVGMVVHLAAVVTPGRKPNRELEYQVDVKGTENVLNCCLAAGVGKIIVSSSGAAYGYYADSPQWLSENDPLRGNQEFAYSDHKRLVEEMLARWRAEHPELKQLIFRPGVVLGPSANNQITNLFDQKRVVGLAGAAIPFVLIWDQDVVGCVLRGVRHPELTGIYNLAGDGVLTMREMAAMVGKPYLALPVWLVKAGLWLMKRLGVTQYGPEQVNFLRYRPVLSNRALKEEFGYTPQMTTRQVFEHYLANKPQAA